RPLSAIQFGLYGFLLAFYGVTPACGMTLYLSRSSGLTTTLAFIFSSSTLYLTFIYALNVFYLRECVVGYFQFCDGDRLRSIILDKNVSRSVLC
ncbi:hypothetical protein, partial [Citrobacter freundii]|uniref:hypothetical protein n=1 Tax=Citrobacter freundii TaxID=546 RepID=UPI002F965D95